MFVRQPYPRLTVDPTLGARLNQILIEYQLLANGNPNIMRELIPASEIWRFFIDGQRQAKDSWLGFEKKEPGYLKGMHRAFQMLYEPGAVLSLDFIKSLHKMATREVNNTNYTIEYKTAEKGEFRENRDGVLEIIKFKTTMNFTKKGLVEFFNANHSNLAICFLFAYLLPSSNGLADFYLTPVCLSVIREYVSACIVQGEEINFIPLIQRISLFFNAHVAESILTANDTDKAIFCRIMHAIGVTKNNEELADCLYCLLSDSKFPNYVRITVCSKQPEPMRQTLNNEIQTHIDRLKYSLKFYVEPLDKLTSILFFIQSCEQTHAFRDANCRTFCMLVFLFLMKENGFPLPILRDPNRFDMFDVSRLLTEVLAGFENTFQLIKQGSVFRATTERSLKRATHNQYHYFRECIDIESNNRQEQKNKRQRPACNGSD